MLACRRRLCAIRHFEALRLYVIVCGCRLPISSWVSFKLKQLAPLREVGSGQLLNFRQAFFKWPWPTAERKLCGRDLAAYLMSVLRYIYAYISTLGPRSQLHRALMWFTKHDKRRRNSSTGSPRRSALGTMRPPSLSLAQRFLPPSPPIPPARFT